MLIQSMTRQASIDLLARAGLGRLACAQDGQPYIVPVTFACDGEYLYAISTLGQKITWMRANPRVCIEVDELMTRTDWATVVVVGRYEEITDAPEDKDRRIHAHKLLQERNPVWWEPAYARTVIDGTERLVSKPMYFRIHINQISGHRGVPDTVASQRSSVITRFMGWLQRILKAARTPLGNR